MVGQTDRQQYLSSAEGIRDTYITHSHDTHGHKTQQPIKTLTITVVTRRFEPRTIVQFSVMCIAESVQW